MTTQPALIVSQDAAGDCNTIGAAISRAEPGDQILIRPGRYQEQLTLDKPLALIGDGPRGEIVLVSDSASPLTLRAEQALLRGLTIRGVKVKGAQPFHAVDIAAGSPVIDNCDIACESLACLALHAPESRPRIRRCLIHDGAGGGIVVFGGGQGLVEDCKTFGNSHAGIAIAAGSSLDVLRCEIYDEISNEGAGNFRDCLIYSDVEGVLNASRNLERQFDPSVKQTFLSFASLIFGILGAVLAFSLSYFMQEISGWGPGFLQNLVIGTSIGVIVMFTYNWIYIPPLRADARIMAGVIGGGVIGMIFGPAGLMLGMLIGGSLSLLLLGWELLMLPGTLIAVIAACIGGMLGFFFSISVWLTLFLLPGIARNVLTGAAIGALLGLVFGWLDLDEVLMQRQRRR